METGKRGYLLSGDPHYLQPYRSGETQMDPALDRLGTLVAGQPAAEEARRDHPCAVVAVGRDAQAAIARVAS